jgi:hypothetical protein
MKNYIDQYKLLFLLSWITFYLLFPSWVSKHLIFQDHGFSNITFPIARSFVIFGMIIYFSSSAYLMNRYFNSLTVNAPVLVGINGWKKNIKDHIWLILLCCFSIALHIFISSGILVLNEVRALEQTFWMYDILNGYWQSVFSSPVQYFFWFLVIILIFVIKQGKALNRATMWISDLCFGKDKSGITQLIYVISLFGIVTFYALLFPYYSFGESLQLIRYPPVSRFIYLAMYFAFGDTYLGPRTVQFTFYILSSIFLYRTILLFHKKEIALLGAAIFLFSPIVFAYAFIASLESGAVFFTVIISFYFLRFIKKENDRDLLLATFFIGTGFLYKRGVMIMFFICFFFLLFKMLSKRNFAPLRHSKILILSWVPILPWLKIGPHVPSVWSYLIQPDRLMIVSQMLNSQISIITSTLLIASFAFIVVVKRDDLSLYFGLFFVAYYCLFTVMPFGEWNHRYLMVLYPAAIAVLLTHLLAGLSLKIRWRHSFKLASSFLVIYLVIICLIPRSSSSIITYKYKDFETQLFPIDKATDWIKNRTGNDEKILVLYMIPYKLYVNRIYADRDKIDQKKFVFRDLGTGAKDIMFPIENLRKFCLEENISYVMFPFGPKNSFPEGLVEKWKMRKYLKENIDSYFINVARYNIEDNYLFIYKRQSI